jgi:hypothetical protein
MSSSFPVGKLTPFHVQESEGFHEAFLTIKDGLTALLKDDEKLVLYYVNGEPIPIHYIQIAKDRLLLLYGLDAEGNRTYCVTPISTAHFFFKILKMSGDEKRTPIGFSITPPDARLEVKQ